MAMGRQRIGLVIGGVLALVVMAALAMSLLGGDEDSGNKNSNEATRDFERTATAIASQARHETSTFQIDALKTELAQTMQATTLVTQAEAYDVTLTINRMSLSTGIAALTKTADAQTAIALTSEAASAGDDPTQIPATPEIVQPPIGAQATPTAEQGQIGGGLDGQQVASVDFKVVSEAGEQLGNGTVRLYSPVQIRLNESAEITVELDSSLNPA